MNIFSYFFRWYLLFFVIFFTLNLKAQTNIPTNLRVDLILNADKVWKNGFQVTENLEQASRAKNIYQYATIKSKKPQLSWIFDTEKSISIQTAYQIIVSSTKKNCKSNIGDIWNSGKVNSNNQISIIYTGKDLYHNTVYYWKVKIWGNHNTPYIYSKINSFITDSTLVDYATPSTPLIKTIQKPAYIQKFPIGNLFYAFEKDAFAQLHFRINSSTDNDTLLIHVGEDVNQDGTVNRKPRGAIRYQLLKIPLLKGIKDYFPIFKSTKLGTGPRSILMPKYIGEVMPFRYVEIEKPTDGIEIINAERYAVNYIFDDDASTFSSSDSILNKIWELSKYTMKATSFTGTYVDGDRERTPYEADALINQLSHYASDAEYNIAKKSLEYLIYNATWPTEWSLQNPLIAWNDYMYSGDIRTAEKYYEELKPKTLIALAREDGLISTRIGKQNSDFANSIHLIDFDGKKEIRDIVDWPQQGGVGLRSDAKGETDGFQFTDYNAVVNAFHYRALICMENLAQSLGKNDDQLFFKNAANKVKQSFYKIFFDTTTGLIKDGESTLHNSMHANMIALAFGLIPKENILRVMNFLRSRGMACSVYGSQFLLDAVYDANDGDYGLELLTKTDKRSWYNMLQVGATMTTEAWDMEYKGNQDWNHAWGSAPANIIVNKLMGITPLSSGFATIQIKPRVGTLKNASLKLSTLHGIIESDILQKDQSFRMHTTIPFNTKGIVYLPKRNNSDVIIRNGKTIVAKSVDQFWMIENVFSGKDNWTVHYKK